MCITTFLLCYVYPRRRRFKRALKAFMEDEEKENAQILKEMKEGEKDKEEEKIEAATLELNKDLFVIDFDEIKILDKIGEGGSNSVVYKSEWAGSLSAFKCFKIQDFLEEDKFQEFEKEVSILSSVNHPHILRFYGCTLKEPRVGILMEYCGNGDLKNHLTKHPEVDYETRLRFATETAMGMLYLHQRRIIHRDLKPENVLLDDSLICKVMDFGISKVVKDDAVTKTRRIGTSFFMAPEVTKGGNYSQKCDVFSFGVLMFCIMTGEFKPYKVEMDFEIEFKIANNPTFRPEFPEDPALPNWMTQLIQKCWEHEEVDRPDFKTIIESIEQKKTEKVEIKKSVQELSWDF